MRRKDREVTDPQEILSIIDSCPCLHLAVADSPSPYIVPLSFGMEYAGGKYLFYFHSARSGRKVELLAKSPRVSVQGEKAEGVTASPGGLTHRFQSFYGEGVCEELTREEDVLHALSVLCRRYGYPEDPRRYCRMTKAVRVYRITAEGVTAKRNPNRG